MTNKNTSVGNSGGCLWFHSGAAPPTIIGQAGAYVCNRTGLLFRIRKNHLNPIDAPMISLSGHRLPVLTRISEDPFINLPRARMLAADRNLLVRF